MLSCFGLAQGAAPEAVFKLSKHLYESGLYTPCSALLKEFRKAGPGASGDAMAALWGKFAADVMAGSWEEANACRGDLATAVDRSSSPKHVTQAQRAWMLHWSLFVFFNRSGGGMEALVENFLLDPYVCACCVPPRLQCA